MYDMIKLMLSFYDCRSWVWYVGLLLLSRQLKLVLRDFCHTNQYLYIHKYQDKKYDLSLKLPHSCIIHIHLHLQFVKHIENRGWCCWCKRSSLTQKNSITQQDDFILEWNPFEWTAYLRRSTKTFFRLWSELKTLLQTYCLPFKYIIRLHY